jgi:DNA-binding GntR family transcriptional regulator
MPESIKYNDLSQQAYEKIKSLIISNKLKPGEKIVQEKLANRLGISRMPLHKAFQQLENELLIERIPRKGLFVRKINIRDIMEAFECRAGLESVAAISVAKNITNQEIKKLENIIITHEELKQYNETKYLGLDHKFHETIIQLSGNHLLEHINKIGNILLRTFPKGIIMPMEESVTDHLKVVEALKKKDGEQASKLLKDHSYKARNILEILLKKG